MLLSGNSSSQNSASGIAWVNALCSGSHGYSFSQVFKFSGSTAAPTSLTFPGILVGRPGDSQVITVRNMSTAPSGALTTTVSPSQFRVTANTCGSLAGAGATCSVTIQWFPTTAGTIGGSFSITGLPPEESYRIVAVDYLEDGEEMDPDFLKRMRQPAARFSLREGDSKTVDLRLIQR